MRGLVVVEVSGRSIGEPDACAAIARDLSNIALEADVVVVHGAEPQIDRELAALEHPDLGGWTASSTDVSALVERGYSVARRVLSASLERAGVRPIALTGRHGEVLRARRIETLDGTDPGRVGLIDEVDGRLLESMLDRGATPVLSPLAPDERGELLTVDADAAASAIAIALGATALLIVTHGADEQHDEALRRARDAGVSFATTLPARGGAMLEAIVGRRCQDPLRA